MVKSRRGTGATETARSIAFCAHTIQQNDLLVIPDTLADERFRENRWLLASGVRFYAGAPLVTHDGHALGSLCVIDRVPRTLTPEQQVALAALSRQAVGQLELRLNVDALAQALRERAQGEEAQRCLVHELGAALEDTRQLSALLPFCSACQFNIVIPADPAAIRTVTDGVAQALRNKPESLDMNSMTVNVSASAAGTCHTFLPERSGCTTCSAKTSLARPIHATENPPRCPVTPMNSTETASIGRRYVGKEAVSKGFTPIVPSPHHNLAGHLWVN